MYSSVLKVVGICGGHMRSESQNSKDFLKLTEKVVLKFEFDDSLNLERLQKYYISDFILYFRKFQNLSSVVFDLSVRRPSFYLNVQKSIGIKLQIYYTLTLKAPRLRVLLLQRTRVQVLEPYQIAHNCLQFQFQGIQCPPLVFRSIEVYKHTHMHIQQYIINIVLNCGIGGGSALT